jgi:N-methylhydantoinase B
MKAGERFLVQSAGGGGYGDPQKRERVDIDRDIAEGYVSATPPESPAANNRRE